MLVVLLAACERKQEAKGHSLVVSGAAIKTDPVPSGVVADPCRMVLMAMGGESRLDKDIALAQQRVRSETNSYAALETLGWLFVSKARTDFDPGFHKLAEQCALCMEASQPHGAEALLLRGHVLQNLHRFKEAEPLAVELTIKRGRAFDYGLLGDVLMEQGRLDGAIAAYQKMADLRPDLQVYTRAAHIRWLKGDLEGAIEMMQMAIQSASQKDAESAAWVFSRMALYRFQAGESQKALDYCDAATVLQSNYPPALLLRGRVLLAEGRALEAVGPLSRAAQLNPLPDYQWTLAEALRTTGRLDEATQLEARLKERGATADPRTFALYLATRGEDSPTAVRLAMEDLNARADVFTHDALAWATASSGSWQEADKEMKLALAEGTQDARLFLHAGIICRGVGRLSEADNWFRRARSLEQMLLPSERARLPDYSASLQQNTAADGSNSP
jgi:tetratricopeptide (TPR) repeat protein